MALIQLGWICLAARLAGRAAAITLTVSTSGGNTSSSYLYGIMFEVIIHILFSSLTSANIIGCRISTTLV